ncbi:hypothetical protein [Deefgea sp. CFH1-16]|uniref:hypothetical protein n=1 Tax=Deefgea sp. CFH1-16 TaxID=2675457 RepID=UPI0015F4D72D|nr:hypothetical protein [Deefgea sp. CFH1-16]MBM5575585.1 hypothetical protein [Deefgea sp. CFH1-16]
MTDLSQKQLNADTANSMTESVTITLPRGAFELANPDNAAAFTPKSKAELLGEIKPYYAVDQLKKELFYHGTRKNGKGEVIPV